MRKPVCQSSVYDTRKWLCCEAVNIDQSACCLRYSKLTPARLLFGDNLDPLLSDTPGLTLSLDTSCYLASFDSHFRPYLTYSSQRLVACYRSCVACRGSFVVWRSIRLFTQFCYASINPAISRYRQLHLTCPRLLWVRRHGRKISALYVTANKAANEDLFSPNVPSRSNN